MPVLAVPLVVPFAEAVGITAVGLGIIELSKKVNEYIQEFPEESMKILSMIMPEQGIAALFNEAAEGEGDEVIEEGEEIIDLDEDKPKRKRSKKEIILEALRKKKGSYASPEAEGSWASGRGRIIRRLKEEGLIPDKPDPNYDPDKKFKGYKRFIKGRTGRKADGGRVGFQTGGALDRSTLNERGQAVYDAMKSSRHSDQSIIDQLNVLGLYNTGTDEGIASIVNVQPNIIDQGRGGNNIRLPTNITSKKIPSKYITQKSDLSISPVKDPAQISGIEYLKEFKDKIPADWPIQNNLTSFKDADTLAQWAKDRDFSLAGAKKKFWDPALTMAGAAIDIPLNLLRTGGEWLGSKLPYNERAALENQMLGQGFALDDIGKIAQIGDYNTPEGIMAGYNAAQMTEDTFDKRMDKIRRSKWQDTAKQQTRISLIQQAKEKWQAAQDAAAALSPVNIPFSGQGAQGGGGGTNIGGGQRGEPTREASYASYDRPDARGAPGYRWKDGGLATMFQRR